MLCVSPAASRSIIPSPVQIIFHKENPGIDYEFYIPVEKKEEERERPKEREREAPRNAPRERPREREQARAPLRSKYPLLGAFPRSLWQLCPKSPINQMSGCTCATRSFSTDTNGVRETLALVNDAKVPPLRAQQRRHLKIFSHK